MISILLPLFNGSKFLHEAIGTIKKQTYEKWHLHIGINGHGLDSKIYKRICKEFEKDKKITVHQYDVKSKPQTLNLLAKEVDSEFVALIDVDDKWHPAKLEQQIPFLKKYDVVGSAGKYIGNKTTKINVEVGKIEYERIFFHNCFINSSVLMRREDVEFDDVFLDDYNMWLKLITKHRKFYNVDQILVYHRLHEESFFNGSNNGSVNKLKEKWLDYYGENKVMMSRFGTTVIMPLLYDDYKKHDIKMSLDSVLKQRWKGYEFLIIISEDKIIKIVKELLLNDYTENQRNFIQVKRLKEKKLLNKTSARIKKVRQRRYYDKCMKLGKYNLIAFIEPRDIWLPNKLHHQVLWIHGYDVHCVGGEFYNHKAKAGKTAEQLQLNLPSKDLDATKYYRSAVLLKRSKFNTYPVTFVRKTFLFHRHMNLIKVHYP